MSYDKDGKPITYGPNASPPQGASELKAMLSEKERLALLLHDCALKLRKYRDETRCVYVGGPFLGDLFARIDDELKRLADNDAANPRRHET